MCIRDRYTVDMSYDNQVARNVKLKTKAGFVRGFRTYKMCIRDSIYSEGVRKGCDRVKILLRFVNISPLSLIHI